MTLEEIETQFQKAITKDNEKMSYDDTWHFMFNHFEKLIAVAKAADVIRKYDLGCKRHLNFNMFHDPEHARLFQALEDLEGTTSTI